jgi:hypothetical protein
VFALPDKRISELENRSLTTKKDISFNVFDGSFQDSLDSFMSDQFPLRDELVYLQTGMYYISGQREIKGAYICDDGRLIQYVTNQDINTNALISYADKINRIAKTDTVYVMYVPSACAVLTNRLPFGAPTYDYSGLYESLKTHLENAKVIDLKETLSDENCYFKTDHHWNANGAYKAYEAFCNAKGEKPRTIESFGIKTVSSDFKGTLYSKIPISKQTDEIIIPSVPDLKVTADGVPIDFYELSSLETKDKYNVFQGGNHGITEIENENGNGKTLLILKDSFANSFVPFIVNDYSKIIMLDERYTFISLEDYIEKLAPDEILVLRETVN